MKYKGVYIESIDVKFRKSAIEEKHYLRLRNVSHRKTYHATECIINGGTTDVYIFELNDYVNSCDLTKEFDVALDEAIEWFDKNRRIRENGIFVRNY